MSALVPNVLALPYVLVLVPYVLAIAEETAGCEICSGGEPYDTADV